MTTSDAAKCWIILGLAYLRSYVPSQPFDPLMKLFLESDFQYFIFEDFSAKIEALELAGSSFMEKSITFRSNRLKERVESDVYPDQPSKGVLEIRSSEVFEQLQRDFNHILRISSTLMERLISRKPLGRHACEPPSGQLFRPSTRPPLGPRPRTKLPL